MLGIWLHEEHAFLFFKETENIFKVLFACNGVIGSEGGNCAVIIGCWAHVMIDMNGGWR